MAISTWIQPDLALNLMANLLIFGERGRQVALDEPESEVFGQALITASYKLPYPDPH